MPRGSNLKPVGKKGRGRPPGTPNKIPTEAKARVLFVFEQLQKNPKTSLLAISKEKPAWFYDTIWKVLIPKQVTVDGDVRAAVMIMLSDSDRQLLQTSIKDLAGAMIEQANK